MELVEDLGAKVNKYSSVDEYRNIFLEYRFRSLFDLSSNVSRTLTVSNNQVFFTFFK